MLKDPRLSDDALVTLVPGPDFPTGGVLVEARAQIADAYATGRGGFRVRARWEKENIGRGQYQIVVTEIPYQVQKARLIERIAELLQARKLALLADVRDESAEDVRIVLEPKSRTVEAELLMEMLFRQTELENRIGLNMNMLDAARRSPRDDAEAGASGRFSTIGARSCCDVPPIGWRRSPTGSMCSAAIWSRT